MLTTTIRPKTCATCGSSFMPFRPMASVCSPTCARRKVEADKKADKAQTKARKRDLETVPQLIKEAQREFNAFIRERDKDKPCICCGRPLDFDSPGGGFDCGHYRSTGSASHLRFDERNAHGQTKFCNRYGAGRAVDYRIGLVNRIGLEAVESLEADNAPVKWDRDTLRQIKTIYRAKARQLLKEQS